MKRGISIVAAVLLCVGGIVSTANGAVVSVAIGDQPYYVHGPAYYVGLHRYMWVPGHWTRHHHHRVWVHGYYVAR